MNNQFFGDERDFYKYALLRVLSAGGKMPVGVCWMLTECGKKSGGGELAYLRKREKFGELDPDLFDFLHACICEKKLRNVTLMNNKIIPGAVFFADKFSANKTAREKYWEKFMDACGGCEVLFFDPDTGIKPDNPGNSADEYIRMDEISRIWERCEKSLVVFQYYRMRFRTAQTKTRHDKIKSSLAKIGGRVRAIHKPPVSYYFMIRGNHEKHINGKIDFAIDNLGFSRHD